MVEFTGAQPRKVAPKIGNPTLDRFPFSLPLSASVLSLIDRLPTNTKEPTGSA